MVLIKIVGLIDYDKLRTNLDSLPIWKFSTLRLHKLNSRIEYATLAPTLHIESDVGVSFPH